MSDARAALLDRALRVAADQGLSDASLRELAAAMDTSHRMVLYHFGSRDGLVAAIVERVEAQQREALADLGATAASPEELMRRQWDQLTDPDLRPFIRLFFEVLAHALHGRPGTERFLDQLTAPWVEVGGQVAERLGVDHDEDLLRLGIAVVRGLLIEVVATGDVEGPRRSLERYLQTLAS